MTSSGLMMSMTTSFFFLISSWLRAAWDRVAASRLENELRRRLLDCSGGRLVWHRDYRFGSCSRCRSGLSASTMRWLSSLQLKAAAGFADVLFVFRREPVFHAGEPSGER